MLKMCCKHSKRARARKRQVRQMTDDLPWHQRLERVLKCGRYSVRADRYMASDLIEPQRPLDGMFSKGD